jgi:spore coat protein A
MSNRRDFLKCATLVGAGMLVKGQLPAFGSVTTPQTPLPGKSIPKYVDALPTFAGRRIKGTNLTVSMEEFRQYVLPRAVYPAGSQGTFVWGYRTTGGTGDHSLSYPGITIEAQRGTAVTARYVNNLPLSPGLQKYLTLDQTIHWAEFKMGNPVRRDPFMGPPPLVTHLHGAEVPSEFDGTPDQWFTPDGLHGASYRTYAATAGNSAVFYYPNGQEATALWFHDHALGATRLDVYAGLAAFYLLRDPHSRDTGAAVNGGLPAGNFEQELLLQDRQFDTNGQWIFPDMAGVGFNGGPPNPDIHPYWNPEFFGDVMLVNGKSWPYLNVDPRRYRFRLVNGCNARFLELGLTNGGNGAAGPAIWVIGTDGGLLDYPVQIAGGGRTLLHAPGERFDIIVDFAGFAGQTLTLVNSAKAPYPNGAAADPQTTGQIMQFRVGTRLTSPEVSYNPASGAALRTPMVRLANASTGRANVTPNLKRQLVLVEVEGPGGPVEVLLNNTKWSGVRENGPGTGTPIGSSVDGGNNYVTEDPQIGSTEEWEIINTTGDAHPIHIHLVQLQLINRQSYNATQYVKAYEALFPGGAFIPGYGPPNPYGVANAAGAVGGNPDVSPYLQGQPAPPPAHEAGWKDTFKMFPGEVTRLMVRFAPQDVTLGAVRPGQDLYPFPAPYSATSGPGYVWHCHILDHEDNEMMRPYTLR